MHGFVLPNETDSPLKDAPKISVASNRKSTRAQACAVLTIPPRTADVTRFGSIFVSSMLQDAGFRSLMGAMQGPVDAQGPEDGTKMEPATDEGFMRIG